MKVGEVEVRGWAPPGLNGPGGLIRMHWATYKRLKAECHNRLVGQNLPEITSPVRAVYTRYGMRWMDWDNSAASAKIPFDVLRALGVIPEDDPTVIRSVENRQKIVKRKADMGFRLQFYR